MDAITKAAEVTITLMIGDISMTLRWMATRSPSHHVPLGFQPGIACILLWHSRYERRIIAGLSEAPT